MTQQTKTISPTLRSLLRGGLWFAVIAGFALAITGCMVDKPDNGDMPWTQPSSWEGTMPMPGGGMGNAGY